VSAAVATLLVAATLAQSTPRRCPPRQLEVPLVGLNLAEEVEGQGYPSSAVRRTLARVAALGANSVALVIPLRLPALESDAFYTYALPSVETMTSLVAEAHRRQLQVVVVPHVWIDGGRWRGDIVRRGAAADRFFAAYGRHAGRIADAAEAACADAFSVGVELKALTAEPRHAERFSRLIGDLRRRFGGVLTYSANWDEAAQVRFWGDLDLISVNGFYPLTSSATPSAEELARGAAEMLAALEALAVAQERPVLLIEVGYKACTDNAREPWVWPQGPAQPVDEAAQERSYRAVVDALRGAPRVVGALFWLAPTGTDLASAPAFEPRWGFSPLGKRAEVVVREAASWARERRSVGRRVTPPGPSAPQRRP